MTSKIIRVVTREADGSLRIREYSDLETLHRSYEQIGIDDCSTDLSLRGWPLWRGLVGPMPDGRGVARYESAEVFEALTKEWGQTKARRRRRGTSRSDHTTPVQAPNWLSSEPVAQSTISLDSYE